MNYETLKTRSVLREGDEFNRADVGWTPITSKLIGMTLARQSVGLYRRPVNNKPSKKGGSK